MKTRNILAGIAAIFAMVLGIASFAAPALAGTSAPHGASFARDFRPVSPSLICVHAGSSFCAQNEGSGNQAQTTTSGTNWNFTPAAQGFQVHPNGNGSLCLQGFGASSNYVVLSEPCQSINFQTQQFTFSGTTGNDANIKCLGNGFFLGVFNPNSGKPIYDEAKATGFYTGWDIFGGSVASVFHGNQARYALAA